MKIFINGIETPAEEIRIEWDSNNVLFDNDDQPEPATVIVKPNENGLDIEVVNEEGEEEGRAEVLVSEFAEHCF